MNKNNLSKIGSVVSLLFAVGGLMYLVSRNYILSSNPVGMGIQAGAVGLFIWARITFGVRSFHAVANTTEGALVINGPYRWFRHPIYAAIIYFVWGGVLSHFFVDAVSVALIIAACLIARMLLEEKFLKVSYDEYKAYSMRTFRVIPFLF